MKNKFLSHPLALLFLYLITIVIFGLIYSSTDDGLSKALKIHEGMYFSVVTITTLGYGEIHPIDKTFMAIVSFQAIVGVLILGFFINSLWQYFNEKSARDKSKDYVSYYSEGFIFILEQYKISIKEISGSNKLKSDFIFSNLKSIFKLSHISRYGYNKSKISVYYFIEDIFIKELRHLRSDIDIEIYPEIHNLISGYFTIHNKLNIGSPLLDLENKNYKIGNRPLKEIISEEISKYQTVPKKSDLISEVINLYNGLSWKITFIQELEKEIKSIN